MPGRFAFDPDAGVELLGDFPLADAVHVIDVIALLGLQLDVLRMQAVVGELVGDGVGQFVVRGVSASFLVQPSFCVSKLLRCTCCCPRAGPASTGQQ